LGQLSLSSLSSEESLLLALAGADVLAVATLGVGWTGAAGCRVSNSISNTPAAKASRTVSTVRMRAARDQGWMASKLV
jgi:hypothetical protein